MQKWCGYMIMKNLKWVKNLRATIVFDRSTSRTIIILRAFRRSKSHTIGSLHWKNVNLVTGEAGFFHSNF
jgi:hypothetical protein